MSSLSFNWLWGRSLRWQLIAGVAILHTLLIAVFVAGLIRWEESFLLQPVGPTPPQLADALFLRDLVFAGLIYTLFSGAVGTLFACLLARSLLKPLRLLEAGVARLAADQFDQPIPITTSNEVASVTRAFNDAMQRLAAQRKQLQEEMNHRLRTQLQAEEENAAKDHFLAVLSHELRTPLTPMLTLAQMLEREPSLDLAVREDIATIRRNVELEARLLDDLLDLTRLKRGKVELRLETVNLHQSLRNAVRLCQHEASAKRIELVLELWADQATVCGDEARLSQVFSNLLRNAIKFTPAGGRVAVQTHMEERATRPPPASPLQERSAQVLSQTCDVQARDVLVEVIDSGIGIEAAAMPHIFEAFEQGGREVAREFGGLGLGLTISRGLVELQGGTLTAHSEGRDRGSTFTVRLPIGAAGGKQKPSAEPAEHTVVRRQILLVEDHPDTALATARLLTRCGYDVQTAPTIATAIRLTRSKHFDLIVSDIGLPDGTGHELIRQLVAEAPSHKMKGIAISGFGQEEDLRRSQEAGFIEHLVKPVDPQALLHSVEEALAKEEGGEESLDSSSGQQG